MKQLTIRTATLEDLEALLRFEQGIVQCERAFDPTLKAMDVHFYDIATMIIDDNVRMLVAECPAGVIGCGFARIDSSKPYLKHLQHGYLGLMYVEPVHRGQGINAAIVDALKHWCRSRNITELRLEVFDANQGAIKAYEKAGFARHMVEMRVALND